MITKIGNSYIPFERFDSIDFIQIAVAIFQSVLNCANLKCQMVEMCNMRPISRKIYIKSSL